MYKSPSTIFFRRLALAMSLFIAACGSDSKSGETDGNNETYHEESLETGGRTQNINNEDTEGKRDDASANPGNLKDPAYGNEDTGMSKRRTEGTQVDGKNQSDVDGKNQ